MGYRIGDILQLWLLFLLRLGGCGGWSGLFGGWGEVRINTRRNTQTEEKVLPYSICDSIGE